MPLVAIPFEGFLPSVRVCAFGSGEDDCVFLSTLTVVVAETASISFTVPLLSIDSTLPLSSQRWLFSLCDQHPCLDSFIPGVPISDQCVVSPCLALLQFRSISLSYIAKTVWSWTESRIGSSLALGPILCRNLDVNSVKENIEKIWAICLPQRNLSYFWAVCSSTLTLLRKCWFEMIVLKCRGYLCLKHSKIGGFHSLIHNIVIVWYDESAHSSVLKLTFQLWKVHQVWGIYRNAVRDWMSQIFHHTILECVPPVRF